MSDTKIEWIKCSDRMPEPNTYCLMYAEGTSLPVMYGVYYGNHWASLTHGHYSYNSITYWQPIPEPPIQEVKTVYVIHANSVPIDRLKALCKKPIGLHEAAISLGALEKLIQEFDKP